MTCLILYLTRTQAPPPQVFEVHPIWFLREYPNVSIYALNNHIALPLLRTCLHPCIHMYFKSIISLCTLLMSPYAIGVKASINCISHSEGSSRFLTEQAFTMARKQPYAVQRHHAWESGLLVWTPDPTRKEWGLGNNLARKCLAEMQRMHGFWIQ